MAGCTDPIREWRETPAKAETPGTRKYIVIYGLPVRETQRLAELTQQKLNDVWYNGISQWVEFSLYAEIVQKQGTALEGAHRLATALRNAATASYYARYIPVVVTGYGYSDVACAGDIESENPAADSALLRGMHHAIKQALYGSDSTSHTAVEVALTQSPIRLESECLPGFSPHHVAKTADRFPPNQGFLGFHTQQLGLSDKLYAVNTQDASLEELATRIVRLAMLQWEDNVIIDQLGDPVGTHMEAVARITPEHKAEGVAWWKQRGLSHIGPWTEEVAQ